MNAELITIGDELLIGQTVDTNGSWMGEQLNLLGIKVCQISSIRDDRTHILSSLDMELLISIFRLVSSQLRALTIPKSSIIPVNIFYVLINY